MVYTLEIKNQSDLELQDPWPTNEICPGRVVITFVGSNRQVEIEDIGDKKYEFHKRFPTWGVRIATCSQLIGYGYYEGQGKLVVTILPDLRVQVQML